MSESWELSIVVRREPGGPELARERVGQADLLEAACETWLEGVLRRGNPHPRNFGTFPRALGRFVREQKLLSWEEAIRKMTSLNAQKVGLRHRGLLAAGYFADITILDPEAIRDRATYTQPFQYPEGIDWVIVNGDVVLEPNGRRTQAFPGGALRRTKLSP